MVYRLVGNVEIEKKEGKVKKLQLKDIVSPSTVVNVPYEAMVELLDKDNAKRYTIKTPGKGSIEEMAKEQGNTVLTLSKQYIAYVISQMQNSSKVVSAQKFTDFATVTRDSSSVKKKPKSEKEKSNWNCLIRRSSACVSATNYSTQPLRSRERTEIPFIFSPSPASLTENPP